MVNIDLSLFDISAIEALHKQKHNNAHKHDIKNARACERPNCLEPAFYKAPKSPQNLNEYRYFCLKHIQEHNQRWNYCENMTEQDIIDHLEKDIVGHRPTWQSGMSIKGGRKKKSPTSNTNDTPEFSSFEDPFDLGKTIFNTTHKNKQKQKHQKEFDTEKSNIYNQNLSKISDACKVLLVDFPLDIDVVKQNYKKLVKKYHPDINKTDKNAGDKLRKIVDAYHLIKEFLNQ